MSIMTFQSQGTHEKEYEFLERLAKWFKNYTGDLNKALNSLIPKMKPKIYDRIRHCIAPEEIYSFSEKSRLEEQDKERSKKNARAAVRRIENKKIG